MMPCLIGLVGGYSLSMTAMTGRTEVAQLESARPR